MTSMTQQLLAGYDQEAGRRCGLKVWLAVMSMRWMLRAACSGSVEGGGTSLQLQLSVGMVPVS
jgi:hypothetical protein